MKRWRCGWQRDRGELEAIRARAAEKPDGAAAIRYPRFARDIEAAFEWMLQAAMERRRSEPE